VCVGLLVSSAIWGAAAESKPQKNYAVGQVTLADGRPLTGDIDDIVLTVRGVSEAGSKVSYSPVVKAGLFKQKLVPGQYYFDTGKIKMMFNQTLLMFDLVPIGKSWNKNRDAEDGIVQDFVWKPTGQKETYGRPADPNNATHWHGLSVGMRFQIFRSHTNQAPPLLPVGTTLFFTLKPTSKSIDGRALTSWTIERAWRPNDITPNDDLNDLPIATYELTGVAQLPDGTSRPILFQGRGHYPNFVKQAAVLVEVDSSLGGLWKQMIGWVTE